jgi:hypothetical protein
MYWIKPMGDRFTGLMWVRKAVLQVPLSMMNPFGPCMSFPREESFIPFPFGLLLIGTPTSFGNGPREQLRFVELFRGEDDTVAGQEPP